MVVKRRGLVRRGLRFELVREVRAAGGRRACGIRASVHLIGSSALVDPRLIRAWRPTRQATCLPQKTSLETPDG